MKLISKLLAVAVVSVGMFSCTNNEQSPLALNDTKSLVEEVTIQKNSNGKYSLNYRLDNASADVFNEENSKKLVMFSSNKNEGSVRENLIINDHYTLSFVNAETSRKTQMTIFDDNKPVSAKGNYLSEYKMKNDGGNIFTLNFKVAKGLKADFVFNKETQAYEIHLAPGKSNTNTFTKNFVKQEGQDLKIDFVNHMNLNTMSKSSREDLVAPKKPRWIIVD